MEGRVFKHLPDATDFPATSRTEPYGTDRVTFDYNRWTPGTMLKLCNVPWDDSRNVVEWENEADRDAWFDDAPGETVELRTMFNMLPDGSVKVPVTSDVAQRYNYLWVTLGERTSADQPLDYADGPGIRSYGYFIVDLRQESPSTTTLVLEMDPFTTYRSHITFTYCQLKRGHAPMTVTDVDTYLADPAHNNQYLLCSDVNYGIDEQTTRWSEFMPFGDGAKLIMFASTMSPEQLAALDEATDWGSESSDPSYYDTSDRWGHQYGVNGYDWNFGDKDYGNLETPVTVTAGDVVPNGYYMYAVAASDALDLFNTIVDRVPQVMSSIAATWMVSTDMVDAVDTTTIAGVTVFVLAGVHDLPDVQITLSKDMFGYPDEYKDITKLYTSPYADVRISDNDGNEITVKIETMGPEVTLHRRVSVAYPYLKAQSFLTGVNGYGSVEYTWTRFDGTEDTCTAWDSEWANLMLQFDIPTYALHYSGYVDWAYRNQRSSIAAAKLKALNDYHKSARSYNTVYENTLDSTDVTLNNTNRSASTARTNANNSATTARSNANASATTARTNANNSATTARENGLASAETALTNANASAATAQTNTNATAATALSNTEATNATNVSNTNATNATNVSNTARTNQANYDNMETSNENYDTVQSGVNDVNREITNLSEFKMRDELGYLQGGWELDQAPPADEGVLSSGYGKIGADIYQDLQVQEVSNAVTLDNWAISNMSSQGGSMANGVIGSITANTGAHAASAVGFNPVSLATTLASTAVQAAQSAVEYQTFAGAQSAIFESNKLAIINKMANSNNYNTRMVNREIEFMEDVKEKQSDLNGDQIVWHAQLNRAITETNIEASNSNAEDSAATSNSNASRSASTSNSNAQRSYDTTVANAQRDYDTTTANAQRSYDTSVANINRTYNTTVGNAQNTYDTTVANATRTYDTAVENADNTYEATTSNAQDTYDVARSNAYETREAAEFSAKTNLEQAETLARLEYETNTVDDAVEATSASGDATPDVFEYRGVQVRVRTQPEGCIRQAGDQMLRYGYMFEGAWDIGSLNLMPYFTYWECEEIWFDTDATIMETARRAIRNLLTNGVTVWRRPEYVGKVGLYENR